MINCIYNTFLYFLFFILFLEDSATKDLLIRNGRFKNKNIKRSTTERTRSYPSMHCNLFYLKRERKQDRKYSDRGDGRDCRRRVGCAVNYAYRGASFYYVGRNRLRASLNSIPRPSRMGSFPESFPWRLSELNTWERTTTRFYFLENMWQYEIFIILANLEENFWFLV